MTLPYAGNLLGNIELEPTGEGQHEGHDMGANVVVVDFPGVGHHHLAFDEALVVVAGRGTGQWAGDPAQVAGPLE